MSPLPLELAEGMRHGSGGHNIWEGRMWQQFPLASALSVKLPLPCRPGCEQPEMAFSCKGCSNTSKGTLLRHLCLWSTIPSLNKNITALRIIWMSSQSTQSPNGKWKNLTLFLMHVNFPSMFLASQEDTKHWILKSQYFHTQKSGTSPELRPSWASLIETHA